MDVSSSSILQKFLQLDKLNNVASPSNLKLNLTDDDDPPATGRSPEIMKDNGVDLRLATEDLRMQKQLHMMRQNFSMIADVRSVLQLNSSTYRELQDTKERLSKISQLMEELQSDQKPISATNVQKGFEGSSSNRFGTNFACISNGDKPYIIDDAVFKNLQDQHCRLNEMKNKLLGDNREKQQRGFSEEFEFKPRKKSSIDMNNLAHSGHSGRSSSAAANQMTQMVTHGQLLFHVQSMMYLLTSLTATHNNACHCCCKWQQEVKKEDDETTTQLSKIVQEQQNMMSSLYAWQQELYSQQIKLSQNLNELCAESLKVVKKTNDHHQKRKSPDIKQQSPDQKVEVNVEATKNLNCNHDDQPSRSFCIEIEDHKNQRVDPQESQIESVSITIMAPAKVEAEPSPQKTSLQIVKEELENKVKDLLTEVSAVLSENDDLIFNASLLQFVRKLVISLTTIKCLPSVGSYANNNFLKKQLSSILDDTLGKFKGFKVKDCSKEILCDVGDVVFNEVSFFRLMQNLSSTSTSVKEKKKDCDDKRTTSTTSLLLMKANDKEKNARPPITQVTTATDEEEEESGNLIHDDDVMNKFDQQDHNDQQEESRNDSLMMAAGSDLEEEDDLSSSDGDLEKFGDVVGVSVTGSNSCSSSSDHESSSSSMHTASPQSRYFKMDDDDQQIASSTQMGDGKERQSSDFSDVEIV